MAGAKTYARNASERPKAGAPPVKDDQDVLGAANAFRTFFSVDAEIDLAHSTRSAHSSSRVPIDADVHWLSAVSGTLDSGSRLSSSMGQIFHGRREKQRGLALPPRQPPCRDTAPAAAVTPNGYRVSEKCSAVGTGYPRARRALHVEQRCSTLAP